MKFLFISFMSLLNLLFVGKCLNAQAPPTEIPPAVIAEARRVAGLMGVTLPDTLPDKVSKRQAKYNGNLHYELFWRPVEVQITVDSNTLKVTRYENWRISDIANQRFQKGEQPSLTEAQATSSFNQLRHQLGVTTVGDWRYQEREKKNYPRSAPSWYFFLRRYHQDRPVAIGMFYARFEPYEGKVASWFHQDEATFAPAQGTLLTKAEAQVFAEHAFLQYAGPSLVPSDSRKPIAGGSGTWETLSDNTTLSRITNRFIFALPEISDPNNADAPLRFEQQIWVDIDGETGELLFISNVLASGPLKKRGNVPISPRHLFLYRLLHGKSPMSLLLAVASGKFDGKALRAKDITTFRKKARSVAAMVAKSPDDLPAPVTLYFEEKTRRLFFEEEKKWYALTVSPESVSALPQRK